MTVVRPLIVSGVFCIVAATSLSGCAHHSGSPFTPATTASVARGDANVIYHKTYAVADRSESTIAASTTISYAGSVTTLPAIVTQPSDVTYDPDNGNFYVVEQAGYNQIQIVRVASTGATESFTSFGGQPGNIAYDHADHTFYLTARNIPGSNVSGVYAVTATGSATVLAGGTSWGQTDGTGSAASFQNPTGITLDTTDGALYLVDQDRVRRVTTAGVVTTLTPPNSIGNGSSYNPSSGIVFNKFDGNFYVADSSANVIRKVTPAGVVTTLAGFCTSGQYYGQCQQLQRDGVGASALFATPTGITVTPGNGNLYVTDHNNNAIRRVTLNGTVTTLAGNGLQADADGAGQNAEFNQPISLTYGRELFVVENNGGNNSSSVRSVTVSGSTPPPLQSKITLYNTQTPAAQPFALDWHSTTPATSTLWYTEAGGKIASLTTSGISTDFSIAGSNVQFADVLLGSDGSQWVYDQPDAKLIHRSSNGTITSATLPIYSYGQPQYPDDTAIAPDGSIWVMQQGGNKGLSHVTPQGTVTSFNNPIWARNIAVAGDGSVWLADGSTIERLDQNGNPIGKYNYSVQFLARGSDGNMWFSQPDAIGKINITNNAIDVFPLYEPVPGCQYGGCSRGIGAVTPGPDGAYWFVEANTGYIGRMDTSGGLSEYQIYAAHVHPNDIVAGPDGNVWFVDTGAQKIGRVKLH